VRRRVKGRAATAGSWRDVGLVTPVRARACGRLGGPCKVLVGGQGVSVRGRTAKSPARWRGSSSAVNAARLNAKA